ncbi:hypothetical protein K6L27_16265 [Burkholderia cenocepacia]|uniref:LysR substrate-binding domain-containing protein n=1 Tax=Burkholderia cenocepacia TaxID=95486 RepID=UPI002230012D|nr:LysR substrate-binding domain-containing protein [Burkholderia cenocepacia]MCW3659729.1 hypothetical protein [Burkholderia cenocepacia]
MARADGSWPYLASLMALPDPDAEIESIALFEDEMSFAASVDSPYAQRDAIDLHACGDEPFVSLGEGFATHHGFMEAFRPAGVAPNVVMRVGNIFSLINLVSGGVGCSLLPGRVRDLVAHRIALATARWTDDPPDDRPELPASSRARPEPARARVASGRRIARRCVRAYSSVWMARNTRFVAIMAVMHRTARTGASATETTCTTPPSAPSTRSAT